MPKKQGVLCGCSALGGFGEQHEPHGVHPQSEHHLHLCIQAAGLNSTKLQGQRFGCPSFGRLRIYSMLIPPKAALCWVLQAWGEAKSSLPARSHCPGSGCGGFLVRNNSTPQSSSAGQDGQNHSTVVPCGWLWWGDEERSVTWG